MIGTVAMQIFSYLIITLMILPFIVMIVGFFVWIKRGMPLMDKPFPARKKSKPANDNGDLTKQVR